MSNYFLDPPIKITLSTFVKNEEHCIEHMLKSVVSHVQEIVVVDTGSTDRTIEICKDYGARIYEVGFTDFGKIRTVAAHLARLPWIIMLDADETISNGHLLHKCILSEPDLEGIALPRKRWLDLKMTQQTEIEAYPDWQVRLIKNAADLIYRRALHEEFHGGPVVHKDLGPVINHFQDVFKDEAANDRRRALYEKLAPVAGVELHGGKVIKDETSS